MGLAPPEKKAVRVRSPEPRSMIGTVMRLLRRKAEAATKWLRMPSRGGPSPLRPCAVRCDGP